MISLNSYRLITRTMQVVSTVLCIIFVGFFLLHTYDLYLNNKNFLNNFIRLTLKENQKDLLISLGLAELKLIGVLAAQLIITLVTKHLLFSLPFPKKWISQWDNQGEISPVLGRLIVENLRYKKNLNSYTLTYLIGCADTQHYMLAYHSKNPNSQNLFQKYDPHYLKDYS